MITLYVKKIWSLNPTKYKYITFEKATKEYSNYLHDNNLRDWRTYNTAKYIPKTFKNWLKTEI